MKHLGRIVSNKVIPGIPEYIEITREFVDDGLPTLFIGREKAVDQFGKINPYDSEIKEGVFWTYSKLKDHSAYDERIKSFINYVINTSLETIPYYFLNIFREKYSFIKKFIKYIDGNIKKSVYYNGMTIFIYSGKKVIGLSIPDCEYLGITEEKIINRIRRNKNNVFVNPTSFFSLDTLSSISKMDKAVPYLHFILS